MTDRETICGTRRWWCTELVSFDLRWKTISSAMSFDLSWGFDQGKSWFFSPWALDRSWLFCYWEKAMMVHWACRFRSEMVFISLVVGFDLSWGFDQAKFWFFSSWVLIDLSCGFCYWGKAMIVQWACRFWSEMVFISLVVEFDLSRTSSLCLSRALIKQSLDFTHHGSWSILVVGFVASRWGFHLLL